MIRALVAIVVGDSGSGHHSDRDHGLVCRHCGHFPVDESTSASQHSPRCPVRKALVLAGVLK